MPGPPKSEEKKCFRLRIQKRRETEWDRINQEFFKKINSPLYTSGDWRCSHRRGCSKSTSPAPWSAKCNSPVALSKTSWSSRTSSTWTSISSSFIAPSGINKIISKLFCKMIFRSSTHSTWSNYSNIAIGTHVPQLMLLVHYRMTPRVIFILPATVPEIENIYRSQYSENHENEECTGTVLCWFN